MWTLVFAWEMPVAKAVPAAFLGGVIDSLLMVRPLGWPSLVMVTLAGGVGVITAQFSLKSGWWVCLSGLVGEVLYRLVSGQGVSLSAALLQGVVVAGVCTGYELLGKKEGVYLKK